MPEDATSYDIVGVGFPVHYYRPPTVVSRAIEALGRLDGISTFAFSVNGSYRGAALNRGRAALTRAGGVELGAFTSYGEDGFYPYAELGALFSPGHPAESELVEAFEFGRALVRAHRAVRRGEAPPEPRPSDPRTHPVYAFERLVTGPRLTRMLYWHLFRVDEERCIRCGVCAKACPVANISWQTGELPSWGRECVLCLNCRTRCPEDAIRCPLDWAILRPFLRWNVHHAWQDPGLDHARAEHRRGNITRL